jgi:hypothetical protein
LIVGSKKRRDANKLFAGLVPSLVSEVEEYRVEKGEKSGRRFRAERSNLAAHCLGWWPQSQGVSWTNKQSMATPSFPSRTAGARLCWLIVGIRLGSEEACPRKSAVGGASPPGLIQQKGVSS